MTEKTTLVNVLMTEELVKRIDDYRYQHRFPSRAEAIRFLIEYGLEQNPEKKESPT